MKQTNPMKFYVALYFFLVLALLQWLIASVLYFTYPTIQKNQYTVLFFFTMGAILFLFYLIVREKVKRVATSKKKIIVMSSNKK
jgi:zinc transporter ZupT